MQGSLDTFIGLGHSLKAQNQSSAGVVEGASVNCGTARYARAFIEAPTLSGDKTVIVKVQSSPTGTGTWTDITGAAFPTIEAASNDNQTMHGLIDLRMTTGPHLRMHSTAAGTGNALISGGFAYGHPEDSEAQRQAMAFRVIPGN